MKQETRNYVTRRVDEHFFQCQIETTLNRYIGAWEYLNKTQVKFEVWDLLISNMINKTNYFTYEYQIYIWPTIH